MKPESNRVEYKRQLTDKFERSVVAFLNYPGGGRMYIGVLPAILALFSVENEGTAWKRALRFRGSCGNVL